jgi:hypothetical protein
MKVFHFLALVSHNASSNQFGIGSIYETSVNE